jgi:NAD(P)-dependent dehydrogenase (short-subunit alcohol dehydrogenase family)
MEPSLFSLKDKVAVVTGALGLLGRQHCYALSEAGATVVACDLNKDECISFASELGNDSIGIRLDVTSHENLVELKETLLSKFGHIDILVNNAAINDMFESPALAAEQSMFENYPLELWKKSLDVNITGTFLCCQVLGTEMVRKGYGSIINIASTYGIVAPDQSLYADKDGNQVFYKSASYPVTKGAVISFTKFLASYWGKKGVRINTLSPGGVENHQDEFFILSYSKKTPLGRMAKPTDYKGALIFLASDASAYMTGSNLIVDGGWTAW